jgi:predicted dehydrogenase
MKSLIFLRTLLIVTVLAGSLHAQEYKIAVIGLVHAHVWGHLRTMIDGKSATLVGVAEPNPELTAEAMKMGVSKDLIYSSYENMLDEKQPNIVWAFVENNRHLEIAKACAARHINLIFEKPLAATYEQAKQIQALAGKYGIRVMTNYQMAWWPANYVAKAAVDNGEIGKPWRLHGIVGHSGPGSEGVRNKYFFAWLTDPVKNGGGALMDFGCYNALWSLWYLGPPQTVYARVNHLRPDRFPKVEDNADLILGYSKGVGIFEGSWDLPRSYQDLEVFGWGEDGKRGSIYMSHKGVDLQSGNKVEHLPLTPLPAEASEPVAYMVSRIRENKPIEGLTAMDINVQVIRIIDLAKESVKIGKAVKFQ